MGELLQLIVSGTAAGAIYALAALGFTLLWQASGRSISPRANS
jgi:branched-chain amino acid transport system permease protein